LQVTDGQRVTCRRAAKPSGGVIWCKITRSIDATSAGAGLRQSEKRREHRRAYKRWTREEDDRLREADARGSGIDELARNLGRAPTAILSRMCQLGIITIRDKPRWDWTDCPAGVVGCGGS
jgi:hypothetical protein